MARGMLSRINRSPGAIVVQAGDPSDARLAADALRSARQAISDLDGGPASAYGLGPGDRNNPAWVSEVIEVPDGPLLMIDGGFTPVARLREIPGIVARRLEQAGVSATVRWPRTSGAMERIRRAPRAVFLRLYPQPPTRKGVHVELPPPWLHEAACWAIGDPPAGRKAMCSLQAVEFTASDRDVASLLAGWDRDRPGYAVICTGDPSTAIRGVAVDFIPTDTPELTLVAGGPGMSDGDMVQAIDDLQVIARELAPTVAYAFTTIEQSFATLSAPGHDTEWLWRMDGPQHTQVKWVCDEIVPDAFPYQVLGPQHIERLGGPPSGAIELATRWELAIGASEDWLFDADYDPASRAWWTAELRRDPTVQAHARELLAPCLLSSHQAHELVAARLRAHLADGT